jgi:hypothetical protein
MAETTPALGQLSLEENWLLANELIAEFEDQQEVLPTLSL